MHLGIFLTLALGIVEARAAGTWPAATEQIDWVKYYKDHGYQLDTNVPGYPVSSSGYPVSSRLQWAGYRLSPNVVFYPVSPTMQWAVPNGCLNGPPCPPPWPPPWPLVP